tara:strand:+ start:1903 stop:2841 length:939 start_codon:yes stop_codon:yes gene_type:complete
VSIRETTAATTGHLPSQTGGTERWTSWSRAALSGSATAWLAATLTGQAIFAAYVAIFYGGAAIAGNYERWGKVLPRGFDAADPLGNALLGLHLLLAVAWVTGGVLQLIPDIRRSSPAFHRWNGRMHIGFAAMLASGGLWLVWVRGGVAGDLTQHLAISINALLILGCSAMAWRAARSRRFSDHQRWALRLFVVASGVWFFRVGLMAWLAVHRRPVGLRRRHVPGPLPHSAGIRRLRRPASGTDAAVPERKGSGRRGGALRGCGCAQHGHTCDLWRHVRGRNGVVVATHVALSRAAAARPKGTTASALIPLLD